MASYIFRRVLLMFPTMIGITLLLFAIMRLAPGGPWVVAVRRVPVPVVEVVDVVVLTWRCATSFGSG